jgi:hydroxybutyrate-dimer hydrolase
MIAAKRLLPVLLTAGLAACATMQAPSRMPAMPGFAFERSSDHRGADDLLTAGLGLDGLRAMAPPAFADPAQPTPPELRRRALWSNWRGIADLSPGGGYGELYGSVVPVPGREFHAYATVPGARHPHRVMAQVPDGFDHARRCLLVAASSGSRGIYGAIAVAGAWGLPRGCAVAYTDKGAGTDYFDLDADLATGADGTVGGVGPAFRPGVSAATAGVAFKHAHSQDNPEEDWGRHVEQAAMFGLHALTRAFPDHAPFQPGNTRIIAVGISNGAGAVLRAAEDAEWLDAVVAAEPNIHVEGARPLYDVATEAALLMPCALPELGLPAMPYVPARCAALRGSGLVEGDDLEAQQASALARLRASGWSDAALRAGAISVGFDLWRAVAAGYAQAYGRRSAGEPLCGYGYTAVDVHGIARRATELERAAWWSDASGIPPGAGVGLLDALADDSADPAWPGLLCLRALWEGEGDAARQVRQSISSTMGSPPRAGLPVVVVHGLDDGLVPVFHTSAPYVAEARAAGRDIRYWQVRNAQHFDAFLGLPAYSGAYVPLLPYVYAALDRVDMYLSGQGPLPADALVPASPRKAGEPLRAGNLAIPE